MGKDKANNSKAKDKDPPPITDYQDEAAHIRQNNDAPLSPTPQSLRVPEEKKKHRHYHNHHHHKSPRLSVGDSPVKTPRSGSTRQSGTKRNSAAAYASARPPTVPNLAEILSDPNDEKMPHREARRQRPGEEEPSGYLEDFEIDAEGNAAASAAPVAPGAVRIQMDGQDEDPEQDNLAYELEKSASKRGTGKDHRSANGRMTHLSSNNNSSQEMGTLPRAQYVTEYPIDDQEREELKRSAEQDAEKAFLAKVAKAEKVDAPPKGKAWMVVALVVVLLAVAGVAVGVVLGTRDKDTTTDQVLEQTVDPSTFDNITATEDACDNAIVLEYPTIVTGSTADATFDNSEFEACGGDVSTIGESGVWYTLRGNGNPLSLSTCFGSGFDTQISIFTGVDCATATCVEGNDQRSNCGTDGSHSTFLAENGRQYFIMVHGLRRSNGVFTLVVDEVTDNSECLIATTIDDSNPLGEVVVYGSTKYSELDNSLNACDSTMITSPGVWYRFVPQSTRFVQARLDDLDGIVTVYTGSCESLQCVTVNSAGMAMWTATVGTEYFIFVRGHGKTTGDFALTVLPGGLLRPPEETNNQCVLSERLETPSQSRPVNVTGSTRVGLLADSSLSCGQLLDTSSSNTMWYSVVGSGNGHLASTCGTETGFHARVAVYEGDCENLVCIGGGDQNCDNGSSVAWISETDKEYFIIVQGLQSRTGDFNLTLSEIIPQSSSNCYNPVQVPLDDVAILGSTENGALQDVGLCTGSSLSSPSVWYEIQGTGEVMVASTCNANSNAFAKLELYSGTCDSLECKDVQRNNCDNQMSLTWESFPGEAYRLQVYGSGVTDNSDFTLKVEEHPEHHSCSTASEELVAGSTVLGSVVQSRSIGANVCSSPDEYGAWYKVTVQSNESMTVSVCSSITNFQASLSLFQGNSCGQLSCIASNNGESCGSGSFLTWDVLSTQEYYILVQGSSPNEIGNFKLTLGIENDICEAAIGNINPGSNGVVGSTLLATFDDGNVGCFPPALSVEGPGVWYTVTGTASLLQVSTCSFLTNFDTRISIYEGDCENLICITGNDNDEACENPTSSSAIWFGEQDVTYYILVHGAETGQFALGLFDVENDACSNAYEVFRPGSSQIFMSERFVSQTFIEPCSGDVSTNKIGAWYKISGTGKLVSLDACGSAGASSQGTKLSVYSEGCTNLSCEADAENDCSLVFSTNYGEDYSVYLETSSADLGLPLEMEVYASNDQCNSAFGPLNKGDIVRGSTMDASLDTVPLCYLDSRGPGVWYTFDGAGETVTFYTCSEFTDFDTQITIFSGDDCGNLECIDSRDDNCGTHTWLTYLCEEGNTYYILVSGKPGPRSTGNYELHVQ
jgi:hypothetical protein